MELNCSGVPHHRARLAVIAPQKAAESLELLDVVVQLEQAWAYECTVVQQLQPPHLQ